ncbi:MAG: hypothetical protein ACE5EF_12750, partial [Dehalococcoidia bacterium]
MNRRPALLLALAFATALVALLASAPPVSAQATILLEEEFPAGGSINRWSAQPGKLEWNPNTVDGGEASGSLQLAPKPGQSEALASTMVSLSSGDFPPGTYHFSAYLYALNGEPSVEFSIFFAPDPGCQNGPVVLMPVGPSGQGSGPFVVPAGWTHVEGSVVIPSGMSCVTVAYFVSFPGEPPGAVLIDKVFLWGPGQTGGSPPTETTTPPGTETTTPPGTET